MGFVVADTPGRTPSRPTLGVEKTRGPVSTYHIGFKPFVSPGRNLVPDVLEICTWRSHQLSEGPFARSVCHSLLWYVEMCPPFFRRAFWRTVETHVFVNRSSDSQLPEHTQTLGKAPPNIKTYTLKNRRSNGLTPSDAGSAAGTPLSAAKQHPPRVNGIHFSSS